MSNVVDPFVIRWPQKWINDPDVQPTIAYLNRFLHDSWVKSGGGDDFITNIQNIDSTTLNIQTSDDEEISSLEINLALSQAVNEQTDDIEELHINAIMNSRIEALIEKVEELENNLAVFSRVENDEMEPLDYFHEVAAGRVPGSSVVLKFGENPDIDTGAFEDIWDAGGGYVPPTQARIHDVVSTSALDAGTTLSNGSATGGSLTTLLDTGATFVTDGVAVNDIVLNDTNIQIGLVTTVTSETELEFIANMRDPNSGIDGDSFESSHDYRVVTNASTGVSLVHIQGIGVNRLLLEEFVVMNGTSNVATSNTFFRQFKMRVFGSGTTSAVGTITSTAQTDLTISCQVVNGNNQTLMAIYTVPLDKIGYIKHWWGSLSGKTNANSTMILRAGTLDALGYIVQTRSIRASGDSDFDYIPAADIQVPGGSDIWVEGDTDTNNTSISSGFDIILEDN